MMDFQVLAKALKSVLMEKNLSYAKLAGRIGMSESGVKKLLTGKDISFSRLQTVCAALGLELTQLLDRCRAIPARQVHLNAEQTDFFLENQEAFDFYWLLVGENLAANEAARALGLSLAEKSRILRQLDELGLIEWHMDDRIRRKVPRGMPLVWDARNPVVRAQTERWAAQLVGDAFGGRGMMSLVQMGLSESRCEELRRRLRAVVDEFSAESGEPATCRVLVAVAGGSFGRRKR